MRIYALIAKIIIDPDDISVLNLAKNVLPTNNKEIALPQQKYENEAKFETVKPKTPILLLNKQDFIPFILRS